MNLELKNIKVHDDMSEETACFSADVWIDGKKAGSTRNGGTGGCNGYDPISLERTLAEYAATLPKLEIEDGVFVDQDADTVIDALLVRHERRKELRAKLASRIVFTRNDAPGVWETKKMTKANLAAALPRWQQNKPDDVDVVFNLLPEAEAFALYEPLAEAQGACRAT